MELEVIWFLIWSFLWIMYFITDGFVLGIGILFPFMGKDSSEREVLLGAVGPLWDGNEVWLITAGAITFGAFPVLYAIFFTSFYTPLMLILFSLIIRGAAFEFREKIHLKRWKNTWDCSIFISSFVAAFLFGTAFFNIFRGVLLYENLDYRGNTLSLLNLYGIFGGAFFTSLFITHGLIWICIKTTGTIYDRAKKYFKLAFFVMMFFIICFLGLSLIETDLYENYLKFKLLLVILIMIFLSLFFVYFFFIKEKLFTSFFFSALLIAGSLSFGLAGIFPHVFPSVIDQGFSLSIYDSSSNHFTLKIMLGVIFVFIPLIFVYQGYAYNLFSHKIIEEKEKGSY